MLLDYSLMMDHQAFPHFIIRVEKDSGYEYHVIRGNQIVDFSFTLVPRLLNTNVQAKIDDVTVHGLLIFYSDYYNQAADKLAQLNAVHFSEDVAESSSSSSKRSVEQMVSTMNKKVEAMTKQLKNVTDKVFANTQSIKTLERVFNSDTSKDFKVSFGFNYLFSSHGLRSKLRFVLSFFHRSFLNSILRFLRKLWFVLSKLRKLSTPWTSF